jgi:hypothetical protein
VSITFLRSAVFAILTGIDWLLLTKISRRPVPRDF